MTLQKREVLAAITHYWGTQQEDADKLNFQKDRVNNSHQPVPHACVIPIHSPKGFLLFMEALKWGKLAAAQSC